MSANVQGVVGAEVHQDNVWLEVDSVRIYVPMYVPR